MSFSQIITNNLKSLDDRIWKKKKAAMIVIDGEVGEGKTTLAVKMADKINEFHGLPPIQFEEQLALGGEDFAKKLQLCYKKKLPVLIYDEAGDFNRRGAMTRLNALLTRTFETFRSFKVMVILCLPSFFVLDGGLIEKGIARCLFRCYGRTMRQGNIKAWKKRQMKFLLFYAGKYPADKSMAYGKVYPLFYGHFQDLDPARSRELDGYSSAGKLKALEDAEIKFAGLLSYSDLSKKVMRSLSWVKTHVSSLKIKPVRSFRKRAYFDPSVADRLLDVIDQQLKK